MLGQQNGSKSPPSPKAIHFLRFFDGMDAVGHAILQSLGDQELRNLQLTSKLINKFLKPRRVSFLKDCEWKTYCEVVENKINGMEKRIEADEVIFLRPDCFMIFGVIGAAHLYQFGSEILSGVNVSHSNYARAMVSLALCSIALLHNGYCVYKYVSPLLLNYINNRKKEVQLEKIQNRIKVLTGSDEAVPGRLKLKKD